MKWFMFDLQAWDKGFPWRRDLFFDDDSPARRAKSAAIR
jgi:hypothetical protein